MAARSTTTRDSGTEAEGIPGEEATSPKEVPARGWLQIAKRGWAEAKTDQVPLLAAGVAFYAFLAIFPALTALVFIYGLVSDPATISAQVGQMTQTLPADARSLITNQLAGLAAKGSGAGVGAVVSVLLALWSASGGVNNLMTAVNTAYDEEEKRSFLVKRGLALLLTLGAIVLMVIMLGLVAALPAVLNLINNGAVQFLLQVVRWVVLVVVVSVALAVLYRVAPDRDAPQIRWVSVGAGVATVLWVIASVGFSLYASFGSYGKTYGALAGIVVLLFWLWITAYAILLGAEINAESEQQTLADTTHGPAQPLGRRGAVKADSVPGPEPERPGARRPGNRTSRSGDSGTGAAGGDGSSRAGSAAGGRPSDAGVAADRQQSAAPARTPGPSDPAELREELAAARSRLAVSVQELTAQINVPARVRGAVAHSRQEVRAVRAEVDERFGGSVRQATGAYRRLPRPARLGLVLTPALAVVTAIGRRVAGRRAE